MHVTSPATRATCWRKLRPPHEPTRDAPPHPAILYLWQPSSRATLCPYAAIATSWSRRKQRSRGRWAAGRLGLQRTSTGRVRLGLSRPIAALAFLQEAVDSRLPQFVDEETGATYCQDCQLFSPSWNPPVKIEDHDADCWLRRVHAWLIECRTI